ncbi:MAG TPA: SH3-like domain-containing protein [Polyangiales bacterium]|nr:SH3-like domain-containing protein [Polyangiales bacterium]
MPDFAIGDRVRVPNKLTIGHTRVPAYVRGAIGTIERVLPEFLIPEDDAFGRRQGRKRRLYRVRFTTTALWPDSRTPPRDEVQIEIYEHWLEPVTA